MIFISHRGNINGRVPNQENKPRRIISVLNKGYDVEIDVWFNGINFFLGHDFPQYNIPQTFLSMKGLWCHAKDLQTLSELMRLKLNTFYHNTDAATLTSKGIIWIYPGKEIKCCHPCICLPQDKNMKIEYRNVFGLCSDYISFFKKKIG
jgi:hypothetical protein